MSSLILRRFVIEEIDSMSEVVAKTMEDVAGIKEHIEKQDVGKPAIAGFCNMWPY